MSKKIVLTGCTKGLGRALVDEFIALGHTVIGCGRNPEAILDLRFAVPAPAPSTCSTSPRRKRSSSGPNA